MHELSDYVANFSTQTGLAHITTLKLNSQDSFRFHFCSPQWVLFFSNFEILYNLFYHSLLLSAYRALCKSINTFFSRLNVFTRNFKTILSKNAKVVSQRIFFTSKISSRHSAFTRNCNFKIEGLISNFLKIQYIFKIK